MEIVGSDAGSIQVFDDERDELRLVAWRGFHPVSAAFWEHVHAGSGSTCGAALASGERVIAEDRGSRQQAQGFGLGLAIAREAATAIGGEITLGRHPDGGTLARVALPEVPT